MHELTDLEQVERIKTVFRQYGWPTLIGLMGALFLGALVYFFQQRQEAILIQNASYYQKITTALQKNASLSSAKALAEPLFHKPGKGPYAQLAALALAKQAVEQGQLTVAKDHLLWAVEHGSNPSLVAIARIRLARVLNALHEPQQALAQLNENKNRAYQSLVDEVKADILLQLGKSEQALTLYLSVQKQFAAQAITLPHLAAKINALTPVT
jgi:predicted negative regulator of RcsB-dependent stress response